MFRIISRRWPRAVLLVGVVLCAAAGASAQDLPTLEEVKAALDARAVAAQSLHVRLGQISYRWGRFDRQATEEVRASSVQVLDYTRHGDSAQISEASLYGGGRIERSAPTFRNVIVTPEGTQSTQFRVTPRADQAGPGELPWERITSSSSAGLPRWYGAWAQWEVGLATGTGGSISSILSDEARIDGYANVGGHDCVKVVDGPRTWYLAPVYGYAPVREYSDHGGTRSVGEWSDFRQVGDLWVAHRRLHRSMMGRLDAATKGQPYALQLGHIAAVNLLTIGEPTTGGDRARPQLVRIDSFDSLVQRATAKDWPWGFTAEEMASTE